LDSSILEIKNLDVHFPIHIGTVRAVEDVTLDLKKGEVMGLVGESGCGKSTLGFSILRLLRPPGLVAGGEIVYHGNDILKMNERELLDLRGRRISLWKPFKPMKIGCLRKKPWNGQVKCSTI